MTDSAPIVIIGSGLAGYTLAREFRKLDKSAALTLITSDDGAFYSKPMLSNALSRNKDAETLATSSANEMADTLNATVMNHTTVLSIDTTQRVIKTSNGDAPYQRLVLACGAQPIRPPMEGNAAHEVLSINNLVDYAHFRERLKQAKRVAIIGPGLIGCEFANDLISTGIDTTVIGPDSYPISGLLPEKVGRALQSALASHGVAWHLGTTVKAVNKRNAGYCLMLENSSEITADLVLSAVGLRPDIRLAESAGLNVNRGIVTDTFLQTSQKGIYALGDCAEVNGLNLPYIAPIMVGARALAKTLSGEPTAVVYPAMPVVIKTPSCPLVVAPPPRDSDGEWYFEGEAPNFTACFNDADGRLLGFVLSGSAITQKQALTKKLPAM